MSEDVLTGSSLGLFFSFFSYRQYYPKLHSPLCHEAHGARIALDYQVPDMERGTAIPYEETSHGDDRMPVPRDPDSGFLGSQHASPSNVTLLPPRRSSIDQHSTGSYEMADISLDSQTQKPRQLAGQVGNAY